MVGGLDEFLYDTFRLPLLLDYYRQMADYRLNAIAVACLVALALILTAVGRRWRGQNEVARRMLWAGCLLSMLVLAVAPIVRNVSIEALRDRSVLILSPATLLLSSYVLVAAWRKEKVSGGNTRETLSLALVFILACQGLIMSFPRTDAAHIQINNTTVFILISFLLWRMYAGWVSFLQKGRRIPATVSVAAGVAVVAAAAVWSMKAFLLYIPAETTFGEQGRKTIASPPTIELGFPRARGVEIPMWFEPHFPGAWVDLSNVIRYVRNNSEADETIFLLCEPQIVYFLSERKSFLQKENYFVHLGAMGLIDSADDVRLTDDQLLEKLIDAKPRFIIRAPAGVHTARIIRLWPKTAAYIDRNYAPTKKISSVYQVLRPRLQEETPAR